MSKPVLPRGVYEVESGVYAIRYADGTRHANGESRIRRERIGSDLTEAKNALTRKRAAVLEGRNEPVDAKKRVVMFGEIVEDWMEVVSADHADHGYDASLHKKLFLTWFGDCPVTSIHAQDIERKLNALIVEGRAKATSNRYRSALSRLFNLAVRNGKLTSNPVTLVKAKRENNARVRFASPEEEQLLREHARILDVSYEDDLDIALHTGMRQSEQYNARWEQVDMQRNVLTVPRSKHGEKRHIQLNSVAKAALERLWARRDGSGLVFPFKYHKDQRAGMSKQGRMRRDVRWFSDRVVKRAGIANLHWHDLRHTFASRLVMAGVDLRTVQELMGHKTMTMTLRYSHLTPSHLHSAVERLVTTDTPTDMRAVAVMPHKHVA